MEWFLIVWLIGFVIACGHVDDLAESTGPFMATLTAFLWPMSLALWAGLQVLYWRKTWRKQ